MKKVNLVYEYDFEDVDIVVVPDEVADNIDEVMHQFNSWLRNPENSRRFIIDGSEGNPILGIDTNEFLWWLNNIKCNNGTKATILQQHTTFNDEYPMADF